MSGSNRKLVLALPSKGRLHEQALHFLRECGFDVRRMGDGREYSAKLTGIEDVGIAYYRPDEIPARVELGDAHIGITGEDLYREFVDGQTLSHLLLRNLGFGAARLVVGVPQSWIDVSTIDDLDEAAILFHQKHGRSLRVATKFARLTRSFFAEQGIVEYKLVESLGATEGTPAAGVADLIVDLTSTGTTMTQNHLKEIDGGTVLRTQCCLVASLRETLWSAATMRALEHLVEQIEARARANGTMVLRFSVPQASWVQIRKHLTGKYGCTITVSRRQDDASAAQAGEPREHVVALCGKSEVYAAIRFLRSSGSSQVVVDRSELIFQDTSPAIAAFNEVLKRHGAGTD